MKAPLVPTASQPKLTLSRHLTFPHHRSGWAYVLEALTPLLKPGGVLLDPFIEATFCWDLAKNMESGELPYGKPWVCFIHNPPGIPEWHEYDSAPQCIFDLPAWRDSMPHCRGIYVFSETMAAWVREKLDVSVAAVVHPSEPAEKLFSFDEFLANPMRRIIQVGSWLRRLHSIALLKVTSLRKTLLAPRPAADDPHLQALLKREAEHEPAARNADWTSVEFLAYQAHGDYDRLLSNNIVFLDLYDTIVNNTVLECIVRRTPVLCNRLPALEELLGHDYPFFFSDLAEAAQKADDLALIKKASQYLSNIPVDLFSLARLRKAIAESEIYRKL